MRIVAYRNERPREAQIFRHLAQGIAAHGDTLEIRRTADYGKWRRYDGPDLDADLTIAYGVKSRDLLKEHQLAGAPWCILDKGYVRRSGPFGVTRWTRVSVNETYPLNYFESSPVPSLDRWEHIARKANVDVLPLRASPKGEPYVVRATGDTVQPGHILVAGSSQKFYQYFEIGDEKQFHSRLIRKLRKVLRDAGTRREIVFRPKPSYEKRHGDGEEPLRGYGAHTVSMPDESIRDALDGAWCLVTFASNAAVDAVCAGVPAVVLGPHVAAPMAGRSLENLIDPPFPKEGKREQWLARLGYEMWTLEEMASGEMWEHVRKRVGPPPLEEWFSFKHWGGDGEDDG